MTTNSIVPYTFIPGTKAKAAEVNENFQALADTINSNYTNTLNALEKAKTDINDKISDTEDTLAAKDLSNSNTFSNCIISAPNGVADYETSEIIIKQGLKVLIPDGFNTDGTLKSKLLETEAEIRQTQNVANTEFILFLCEKSEVPAGVDVCKKSSFYFQDTTPENITSEDLPVWFKPGENKYYRYTGSSDWAEYSGIAIAEFVTGEGSVIDNVKPFNPVNLLKFSDNEALRKWIVPDYRSTISFAEGGIAPTDGWIFTPQMINSTVKVNDTQIAYGYRSGSNFATGTHCQVPVCKGDNIYTDNPYMIFIPMKGVANA